MIAVAAGVVYRGNRILLCQRKAGGHQALTWEFPGGKLEAGESPEQALARRIADAGRDLLLLFYAAEIASGEPRPLDCRAVVWAEPSALTGYDLAEADRSVAEALAAQPPSGAKSDV